MVTEPVAALIAPVDHELAAVAVRVRSPIAFSSTTAQDRASVVAIGTTRTPSNFSLRFIRCFFLFGACMALLSRILFAAAGFMLAAMAAALVVYAAVGVVRPEQRLDFAILDAIGYLVIAIAVFDVSKYLIDEEVIREREMRHAGEARRSLTRIVATIIIATLLEATVVTFKAARERVSDLVYPALLIFAGVALLVGLGAYQRLSVTVERATREEAESTQGKDDA